MKRFARISAAVAVSAIVLAVALFVNVWFFKPVTIDAFYASTFVRFALDRPDWIAAMKAA